MPLRPNRTMRGESPDNASQSRGRRKLCHADATTQRPAAERMFDMMAHAPDKCCYGSQHTQQALELYAISELLIADKPYIGGLSVKQWESWASVHKVSKVHRVSKDSAAGKKFCNDVGVAGFLLREVEFVEEAPEYLVPAARPRLEADDRSRSPHKDMQLAAGNAGNAVQPSSTLSLESSATGIFFKWLRLALEAGTSDADMLSEILSHTRYLLLEAEGLEPLTEARGFLEYFDSGCADQLETRWHAAHYAETPAEAAIAASLADFSCAPAFAPIMRTDSTASGGSAQVEICHDVDQNLSMSLQPCAVDAIEDEEILSDDVAFFSNSEDAMDEAGTQCTCAPMSSANDYLSDCGNSDVVDQERAADRAEPVDHLSFLLPIREASDSVGVEIAGFLGSEMIVKTAGKPCLDDSPRFHGTGSSEDAEYDVEANSPFKKEPLLEDQPLSPRAPTSNHSPISLHPAGSEPRSSLDARKSESGWGSCVSPIRTAKDDCVFSTRRHRWSSRT